MNKFQSTEELCSDLPVAVSISYVILGFSLLEFLSPLGLLSSHCLNSPVLVHLHFMVVTL